MTPDSVKTPVSSGHSSLNPPSRDNLFARGFLISTKGFRGSEQHPLLDKWHLHEEGGFFFLLHEWTRFYRFAFGPTTHVLIGHAYDPFEGSSDEASLLEASARALSVSRDRFFDVVSRWTGRFVTGVISGNEIELVQDCAGMRSLFYGQVADHAYISSHAQLIGDVCKLSMDPFVKRLIASPAYRIGIRFLPGDLSPFTSVRRLGPNTSLTFDGTFRLSRFYPRGPLQMLSSESEKRTMAAEIGETLRRSMELVAQKWDNPGISLTGGTDSRTTLAASRGLHDRFRYFTFCSNKEEGVDYLAAQKISRKLGLRHDLHMIPGSPEDIPGYASHREVVHHNSGYVRQNAENDLRKLAYFANSTPYDVDVKSWASEIGRSNFCKRLAMKALPEPLSPRQMSILYKRIFFDRRLLREVDQAFADYMEKTNFGDAFFNIDSADMVYWEHRFPGWGALCLNEFDMCWETTVIFNNRRLLEMFLAFPREDRIADRPHRLVVEYLQPELNNPDLHVVNFSKQRARVIVERLFFEVNSRLP